MRGWCVAIGLLTACTPGVVLNEDGEGGTQARFDVGGGFWASPFPSDHRVDDRTRRVLVDGFPNPDDVPMVDVLKGMLHQEVQGWSQTAGIVVPFSAGLNADRVPTLFESLEPDATVQLIDVDRESPTFGDRHPIHVQARSIAAVFGPEHAVVALPFQGLPLAPRTRYALVVDRTLRDADDFNLVPTAAIRNLVRGEQPTGWRNDVANQYVDAIAALEELDVDVESIVGLSVFTTGRATKDRYDLVGAMNRTRGLRVAVAPKVTKVYDDFCLLEGSVEVPVFQGGEPPYATEGGGLVWGDDGPEEQRTERARLFMTLPKRVPSDNQPYKTVVFIRTGGGGDRPLIDRGMRETAGEDVEGTGFAAEFGRRGYAAVMIDGPLGGLRNPDGADEQFLIFNVNNPAAMRGTLQQSALELFALPEMLGRLLLPITGCPGIPEGPEGYARFDDEDLVLFGHSMGATIAPVVAAWQPAYTAMVVSGAGGSWIQNVVHKTKPIPTLPVAATMLSEPEEAIDAFHPALSLLQWAGESVDPPLWGSALWDEEAVGLAPDILMVQGVADHYIPPPVANAASVSLELDLGGDPVDGELSDTYLTFSRAVTLRGSTGRALPAGYNRRLLERPVTRILVQHAEDGIEDGHEVAYQREAARHQIDCFVHTHFEGGAVVAAPGYAIDPCPEAAGDE